MTTTLLMTPARPARSINFAKVFPRLQSAAETSLAFPRSSQMELARTERRAHAAAQAEAPAVT